jgi:hypothetical protein
MLVAPNHTAGPLSAQDPNIRSSPLFNMVLAVPTALSEQRTVPRLYLAVLCSKTDLGGDRRPRLREAFNTCPFQLVLAEAHPCQLLPCRLLEGSLRANNPSSM